ncbi:hypothetical protein ACFV24_03065 [Nocardia fluminea]|uniref:hypothetical protein n=1 Tax=Nocardia fluminea TaxID=134984 RepID=UPI00366C2EB5
MPLDLKRAAETFYRAMAAGDVSELTELIETSFADTATLSRPESLPGGGARTGRDRILRFLEQAAGRAPLKVHQLEINTAGTELFACVEVMLGADSATALEWWTSDGTSVTSVRAFYWDTAAMVAGVTTAPSHDGR